MQMNSLRLCMGIIILSIYNRTSNNSLLFLPHDNYYNSYAVFVQKNDIFCSVFYYPLCNLFYVLLHLQLQSCTAVHLSILVK